MKTLINFLVTGLLVSPVVLCEVEPTFLGEPMFNLFSMIRTGVKNAILGGISDAASEIDQRLKPETEETDQFPWLTLEKEEPEEKKKKK